MPSIAQLFGVHDSKSMYLRRKSKMVKGARYDYWALVESARTARGPCQRVVASIGKLPGLDQDEHLGWEPPSIFFSMM